MSFVLFFFNETATTAIYTYGHTLSRHDALPLSSLSDLASFSSSFRPGAWMPSSLVTSTRAFFRLSAFLTIGGPIRDDDLQPAQVGPQRRRHLDAAVGLLVVLHHLDEAAAAGHARAVQGMHERRALFLPHGAEADIQAADP